MHKLANFSENRIFSYFLEFWDENLKIGFYTF